MTKNLTVVHIIVVLICFSCKDKIIKYDNTLYFDKNSLSEDNLKDSLRNQGYTDLLKSLGETSLRDTSNRNETIRLTVPRSIIFSTYCIRIDKIDSLYVISFKIDPDPKELRRTGLDGLTLTYKSNFWKMDTLYQELVSQVSRLDIFNQDNSTPDIVIQKQVVGADGITYLLEYYKDGRHVALTRWDGFLEEKFYKKSDEFIDIVKSMHSLVPKEILPDYLTAREIEDVRFPIFKKNKK